MKTPKIKVGTVVLRWNGVSNDRGIVFSITKKEAIVMWKGAKEKVEKDTLKWQHHYDYDKEEWTAWNWAALAKNVMEVPVKKTEGAWIKTYRAGELVSMKLTKEAYELIGQKKALLL